MSKPEITHLAFIDVETTGLDRHRDPIIEIAMVLTDLDLEILSSYTKPVHPGPGILKSRLAVNPFVEEMHSKNGLLSCLEAGNHVTPDQAERDIITIFQRHLGFNGQNKIMIAGSGVAQFDQQVLRLQMPLLDDWLAYYPMDTGVVRRFIEKILKRPDLLLPEQESEHRAMSDVVRALDEARYYRDCLSALPILALDEEG